MITYIGWAAICYIVLRLIYKILLAHQSKDRSWYEDHLFPQDDTLVVYSNDETLNFIRRREARQDD